MLRLRSRGIDVRFPAGTRDFFFTASILALGLTDPSTSWETEALSSGV
jgi:hypothetical protein